MKNNIKRYRRALGLTQRALAKQLYISASTMYGWEHGRHDPSMPDAVRLADVLGVTLDQLYRDGGAHV